MRTYFVYYCVEEQKELSKPMCQICCKCVVILKKNNKKTNFLLGHEGSGIVEMKGSNVKHLQKGSILLFAMSCCSPRLIEVFPNKNSLPNLSNLPNFPFQFTLSV